MRSRYLLPFGSLCVGLPVLVYFVPRLLVGGIRSDSIGHFDGWEPSAAAIRKAVVPGPDSAFNDQRHIKFAQMFQQRFRNNQKAVGISFVSNDRIKAKFAATIPRWDMAHVATELHDEVKSVFGQGYKIDIYETYISLTPRKLAEVREGAEGKSLVIDFNPKFESEPPVINQDVLPAVSLFAFVSYISPTLYPSPMSWFATAERGARRAPTKPYGHRRPALIAPPTSQPAVNAP